MLNMNCLCAIYIDRNQRAFLAQMTSFVMRYDVIYHLFPIGSRYLMTLGADSPCSKTASYTWSSNNQAGNVSCSEVSKD